MSCLARSFVITNIDLVVTIVFIVPLLPYVFLVNLHHVLMFSAFYLHVMVVLVQVFTLLKKEQWTWIQVMNQWTFSYVVLNSHVREN
jgi:hypothetical protein